MKLNDLISKLDDSLLCVGYTDDNCIYHSLYDDEGNSHDLTALKKQYGNIEIDFFAATIADQEENRYIGKLNVFLNM